MQCVNVMQTRYSVNSHLTATALVLDSPSLGASPLRWIGLLRRYSMLLMVYLVMNNILVTIQTTISIGSRMADTDGYLSRADFTDGFKPIYQFTNLQVYFSFFTESDIQLHEVSSVTNFEFFYVPTQVSFLRQIGQRCFDWSGLHCDWFSLGEHPASSIYKSPSTVSDKLTTSSFQALLGKNRGVQVFFFVSLTLSFSLSLPLQMTMMNAQCHLVLLNYQLS